MQIKALAKQGEEKIMNKTNVMDSVLNILHLDEISRTDNGYGGVTVIAGSPLFSKQVKIYNLTSKVFVIEMICGVKVCIDSDMSAEAVLKEIVNFIAENTKVFFYEPKILCWGFNCNLAYVKNLIEALSENQ